jgi:hypothetical protein
MLDMTGHSLLSPSGRLRRIQPWLKDFPVPRWQAEYASQREGHAMSEQAIERRRLVSDIIGVASYSILVLLIMLAWTYVPA